MFSRSEETERSENITQICRTKNAWEWIQKRRIEWNGNVGRMENDDVVKVFKRFTYLNRDVGRERFRENVGRVSLAIQDPPSFLPYHQRRWEILVK